MELVQRMTMAPNRCLVCGCGNVADNDGNVGPFIDLRIDYNWGDSGYLCMECAGKIAAISGWITEDEKQSLEAVIAKKDREIHDVRAKMELKDRRYQAAIEELNKIREGSRALKRVRREKVK